MEKVTEKFNVYGMTCAACQANVEKSVKKLDGVESVAVSLLSNSMTVVYDKVKQSPQSLCAAVDAVGYKAETPSSSGKKGVAFEWSERKRRIAEESKKLKFRLITSVILLLPLMYLSMGPMAGLPQLPFFKGIENALPLAFTELSICLIVLLVNRKFFTVGFKALIKRAPNMDTLVAVGAAASFIYGIFALYVMFYAQARGEVSKIESYSHQLYFESGAMIVTLVTVGKFLEGLSKNKTSGALDKLITIAPKTATVISDGKERIVPAEELQRGDVVLIKPGERTPADGKIIDGYGYLDQSAITGESLPIEKGPGDTVICASVNKNGSFTFSAENVGEDTSFSKIIALVDEAGNTKAPIARLADKISGIFVPCVLAAALVTLVGWLIAGYGFEPAFSMAVSVLVISCPCALGLATPVAVMAATGKAAEFGILIKSAESLEILHKIDTVVMDKTGTITEGKPSVTDIISLKEGLSEKELLRLAASLEKGSEHPLAFAVQEAAEKENLELLPCEGFEAVFGKGVKGILDTREYFGGKLSYLKEYGAITEDEARIEEFIEKLAGEGKTPLVFASKEDALGIIAVADKVRETSGGAILSLKENSIKTYMLTGDNALTANYIGNALGVDGIFADVLPEGKAEIVKKLKAEGKRVAMVGDGINDSVALTEADVGIAIGAGTDVAIEAADVTLVKSDLQDVTTAIRLGKSAIRNIKINLFWAFFYNVVGIPLAAGALYPAFGIKLNPMIGAAAMSLSSVCVVLNALRLRFFKNKSKEKGVKKMEKQNMVLEVKGMMCPHCQARVEKAIADITGAEVKADFKTGKVTVTGQASRGDIENAVKNAGYEIVKFD